MGLAVKVENTGLLSFSFGAVWILTYSLIPTVAVRDSMAAFLIDYKLLRTCVCQESASRAPYLLTKAAVLTVLHTVLL